MSKRMAGSSTVLPTPAAGTRLGARVNSGGTTFGLWAPRASRVELALVGEDRRQQNHDMRREDDGCWQVHVPGVGAGQRYGYRVHGVWAPQHGVRFNPAKLLLDPYARAITNGVDYAGPIRDHTAESDYVADPRDSSGSVPLSVVVADSPPPRALGKSVPLADTVLYELHVKGYTQLHPSVPEQLRGSYAGLVHPAVTEHLVDLGVTSVELLPVQHFVSEPFLIGRGLSNFWGYNTLGFFAPHASYCSLGSMGQQVREFKEMVSAFHDAGLEVILDVVYNHTGEGGHEGPTLAFRGIDHAGHYRLSDNLHNDYDVTGCGNSVDTAEPGVLRMVLDSLRYWVTEMGVDGFRFDLATTLFRDGRHRVDMLRHTFGEAVRNDPVLSRTKLIAEPWDLGPDGYQLGAFGPDWTEWNDRFRNYVRDFWRGNAHGVSELAVRLSGSPDIFDRDGRGATSSVNFVTAHDGFTLRDLVTYNVKHNRANGESNRDGTDDNRSWNCGVEGEVDDDTVVALRLRQAQNLMATMIVATGVPMITAGDELGRTQDGNNNAYCQDSPVSWVHWDTATQWSGLTELTQKLLELRAEHPVFRRTAFRHGEPVPVQGNRSGRKNLAWFGGGSVEMTAEDWADGNRHTLGMYIAYDAPTRDHDDAYLIWIHGGVDAIEVHLPDGPWADTYTVVAHSGLEGELPNEKLLSGTSLWLPGRTVAVLQVD